MMRGAYKGEKPQHTDQYFSHIGSYFNNGCQSTQPHSSRWCEKTDTDKKEEV